MNVHVHEPLTLVLALVAKAHMPFVCEAPALQVCSNKFVSMFASAFCASHFSMSAFLMTPHFQYSLSVHPLAIVVYRIALKFRGSLILRISRIWNHSRKYFNENFVTLCSGVARPHVRARASTTMALLENFKREDAQYAGCKLPDPQGALAKEVPPIAASDFTTATAKGSRRLSGSLAHTSSSPINASQLSWYAW